MVITCMAATTICMAGYITGGSLLADTDANQLENWMGVSDQNFVMVWSGEAGVATASSFHAAVDGIGPTISIYQITLHDSSVVRIGGRISKSWGGFGYAQDSTAFIFNLDSLEIQRLGRPETHDAYYRGAQTFSTFGAGNDIYGGGGILGTSNGAINSDQDTGYSYSWTYDQSQGQIAIAGDSGARSGDSGIDYRAWSVNSLEVYTYSEAIPEPSSIILIGLSAGGIFFMRRRRFF